MPTEYYREGELSDHQGVGPTLSWSRQSVVSNVQSQNVVLWELGHEIAEVGQTNEECRR